MEFMRRLEKLGYQFDVRPTYKNLNPSKTAPPEAQPLFAELEKHKGEAVLYIAERKLNPKHSTLSERCRTDITKGILAAQNPYDMLIQAIQCISLMTGDSVFYNQNLENIKVVYGIGLSEPESLAIELSEVRQRLQMLQRPELASESADIRKRIGYAIKAHQEREAQLMTVIDRGGDYHPKSQ